MPSRLARLRCDRRSTSAGGSREPSERAMAASVAPSARRHLRRAVAVRAARSRPPRRPTARIVKPPRRGPRLAPWPNAARIGPWLDGSRDGLMERLQWWLLLLSAVMFSMSGCSSTKAWQGTALSDWQVWAQHSSHFASGQHLTFSIKSHPTPASISEADKAIAAREEWWGQLVPQDKVAVVAKTKAKPKPSMPPAAIASSSEPTNESTRAAATAPTATAVKESW